jgi:SNF2 family DNA or RNA helicase
VKAVGTDGPRKSEWQKLMNLLMQLRKVCNHPYQIGNAEPDPYETGDHVITASGKFIVLEKLLAQLVIKNKKKIRKCLALMKCILIDSPTSNLFWIYQDVRSG